MMCETEDAAIKPSRDHVEASRMNPIPLGVNDVADDAPLVAPLPETSSKNPPKAATAAPLAGQSSPSIEIARVELPLDGLKYDCGHVYYTIAVTLTNGFAWTVEKGFSDFYNFHERLAKVDTRVARLPFPKKRLFGNKTEAVIRRRRDKFEAYLRNLLTLTPLPTLPMFIFLAVYGHVENLERKRRCEQKNAIAEADDDAIGA
ncbi:Aste57867_11011 [Aphanomyces stellatus]|uniref:Aste57867_11011 protein n=1 Tax=Aphanomyces stellatus TaxID=120398 RepID=A0A485KSD2_9STRA|nr:hypothetical protein As57867_010970 [Aphanomyces stellatus]VFT87879.1 Aste57867_11011 [Aphanomyces stellatus]